MSRGLGRSQRLILDTLQEHGAFFLVALADSATGAKYKALHRAAMRLQEQERIKITMFGGQPRVAIQHVGPRVDLDQTLETSVVIAKRLGQDHRAFRYWCDLTDEGQDRTREIVDADRIMKGKHLANSISGLGLPAEMVEDVEATARANVQWVRIILPTRS